MVTNANSTPAHRGIPQVVTNTYITLADKDSPGVVVSCVLMSAKAMVGLLGFRGLGLARLLRERDFFLLDKHTDENTHTGIGVAIPGHG